MSDPAPDNVLEIDGLRTEFRIGGVWRAAVDGVSLVLARGETLALVGESGCGKSITALSVMGLVPAPAGRIGGGHIRLEGEDLVGLPEERLEKLRGDRMAMIFQEPMTSLNPVMTIGDQTAEMRKLHPQRRHRFVFGTRETGNHAELGARPGRIHDGSGSARKDRSACQQDIPAGEKIVFHRRLGSPHLRQRLAGHRRRADPHGRCLDHPCIGRNVVALLQQDDVPGTSWSVDSSTTFPSRTALTRCGNSF